MMRSLRTISLAALLAATLAAAAGAEPKTLVFDRAHSEVGFDIRHFFNKVHGRFTDYAGQIVYDPANLALSKADVTIRDTSIYTANERRDGHLRTQDFFWTEKYPTIAFHSTKVIPGADSTHFQVVGNLTIRDVTKPVTLDVEYLGTGAIGMGGKSHQEAGFMASTTINRKDFGIVWNRTMDQGGVMLGDDVEIVLNVAAREAGDMPPGGAPKTAADKH